MQLKYMELSIRVSTQHARKHNILGKCVATLSSGRILEYQQVLTYKHIQTGLNCSYIRRENFRPRVTNNVTTAQRDAQE